MIKEPRYLQINTNALKLIARVNNPDIIVSFVQEIKNALSALMKEEPIKMPENISDPVLQIALEDALPELETGFHSYMQRVNANLSGERKKPMGGQWVASGNPNRIDEDEIKEDEEQNEANETEAFEDVTFHALEDYLEKANKPKVVYEYAKKNDIIDLDGGFWNTAVNHGFSNALYGLFLAVENNAKEKTKYASSVAKKVTEYPGDEREKKTRLQFLSEIKNILKGEKTA